MEKNKRKLVIMTVLVLLIVSVIYVLYLLGFRLEGFIYEQF